MTTKLFYTIMTITKPKKDDNNEFYSSIISSYFIEDKSIFNIDPYNLYDNLSKYFNESLNILFIDRNFNEMNEYKLSEKEAQILGIDYHVYEIPYTIFFTEEIIQKIINDNNNMNNIVFVFVNIDYFEIKSNFALFKLIISGGSNNKKHILSPIQYKLARFILAISSNSELEVTNSYHSFGDKKSNKPILDFSNKEFKNKILNYSSLYKKQIIENQNNKNSKSFPSPIIKYR